MKSSQTYWSSTRHFKSLDFLWQNIKAWNRYKTGRNVSLFGAKRWNRPLVLAPCGLCFGQNKGEELPAEPEEPDLGKDPWSGTWSTGTSVTSCWAGGGSWTEVEVCSSMAADGVSFLTVLWGGRGRAGSLVGHCRQANHYIPCPPDIPGTETLLFL